MSLIIIDLSSPNIIVMTTHYHKFVDVRTVIYVIRVIIMILILIMYIIGII